MIYLAGPLFTMAEIEFNKQLAAALVNHGFSIFLPQEACTHCNSNEQIYHKCIEGIHMCNTVLAVFDGSDADSGTSFEAGFARALDKKIIGLRTDFRNNGDDGALNLMLSKCCTHLVYHSMLTEQPSFEALAAKIIPFL